VPVPDKSVLGDIVINKVFDIIERVRVVIESGKMNSVNLIYGVDSNCRFGDDAHRAIATGIQAGQIRERAVSQMAADIVEVGRTGTEDGPVGEDDFKVKD